MARTYRLIVFNKGKRIEKRVPLQRLPELKELVRKLRAHGVKCCVALSNITPGAAYLFPPPDEIQERREEGKLWCPYCRDWRWFRIPKAYPNAEIMTREWFLNVSRNNETSICAWCEMPITDFYVGRANGIWAEVRTGTRRRRRKPGVRKRVSRRRQM
jgi:hypothetical protein